MTAFDLLHPVVQHHVVNTLGWASLRPLQEMAVEPLSGGLDALLLAPTAGGKTEAAMFPTLSRMAEEDWRGTSVLYVAPLRALLNNLEARLQGYAGWLGRSAAVRHGDTGQGARRRQLVDRVDVLLTTPESLESMLVSATIDPHVVLADVRVVIVDEVHAFAGDDRGWHLLAVLERVGRIAGRRLQRIGLSATVGNASELLTWLQGSNASGQPGVVVQPDNSFPPAHQSDGLVIRSGVELELDYVGSVENAAKVIAVLHHGEKRLVFADSRRVVERLASRLRVLDVDTHVSHSSLAAAERRRSEAAFAEGADCVIVATSTLELGIDVGDLDRVLQIGAPSTVASLLQRMGRTGRRPGTSRNMLMMATTEDELVRATAVALLWSEGYVEPVVPPATPLHLAGQQLLALCLQERRVGRQTWPEWLNGLPLAAPDQIHEITDWLLQSGHLDEDSGMLFVGPEAERRYGRRHFMEVMSVFTSAPVFVLLHGHDEIGSVDPMVLLRKVAGPRLVSLGGRTWLVRDVDWTRRKVHVEPADGHGLAEWIGAPVPFSYRLADAMRRVLLGADPAGARLSNRAVAQLQLRRETLGLLVDPSSTVIAHEEDTSRWWTWAGMRANAVLHGALLQFAPEILDSIESYDNLAVTLRSGTPATLVNAALEQAHKVHGESLAGVDVEVERRALDGLKFSDLLPPELAVATLAARMGDRVGASRVCSRALAEVAIS